MLGDPLTLEIVNDPAAVERNRKLLEAFSCNSDWLESNWQDLLPEARGKHLAVAGRQAFCANTPEEAWDWVKANHSEDIGAFVRYVIPEKGPRIYARRWHVENVR